MTSSLSSSAPGPGPVVSPVPGLYLVGWAPSWLLPLGLPSVAGTYPVTAADGYEASEAGIKQSATSDWGPGPVLVQLVWEDTCKAPVQSSKVSADLEISAFNPLTVNGSDEILLATRWLTLPSGSSEVLVSCSLASNQLLMDSMTVNISLLRLVIYQLNTNIMTSCRSFSPPFKQSHMIPNWSNTSQPKTAFKPIRHVLSDLKFLDFYPALPRL